MISFKLLHELAYDGNVGIHELMLFYKLADDEEKEELDRLFSETDIKGALTLIEDVTGVRLINNDEEDEEDDR